MLLKQHLRTHFLVILNKEYILPWVLCMLVDTGRVVEYDIAGPIEIRFKNRRCVVEAMALPEDNELLLGAILLEDRNVIIHPMVEHLL